MILVYRHINLDTNTVFYVGIGTEKRAYDYRGRNSQWLAIAETSTIETEVLVECNTREEAYRKEREFIALYGRVDKQTGTLVNRTDGGGWLKGVIWSPERKKESSDRARKYNVLKKWQELNGPAVRGRKLPKQKQDRVEARVEKIKQAWQGKTEEQKKAQTTLFINNNPSYRVQDCSYCKKSIQGASAFKRFHGENCKQNKNNLKNK